MSNDNIDEILKATEGHTPGPWADDPPHEFEDDTGYHKPGEIVAGGDDGWPVVNYAKCPDKPGVREAGGETFNSIDPILMAAAPALRAEVVRLREREAAVTWLRKKGWWAANGVNGAVTAVDVHWDGHQWNVKDGPTAPDPVALCNALDPNWRKTSQNL